jgi:hypothetical protein
VSEARLRRVFVFATPAFLLTYYLFFVWPGLKLYFDNDDMMNLYFAWSKPLMESYRPLGALFYRTIFSIAGFHPLPFRIACVVLGALNMGLCYRFAMLVTVSHRVAALTVLLFAFHSRMMEVWYRTAVVYDLLCFAFFYLGACIFMSRRRVGVGRGFAVIACFAAALAAKEVAVTLPVILLVWALFMRGKEIELTDEEVERRAWEAVHSDLPALAEAYRKKFGTEIGTDNAREIVSKEYAESLESRTRWSRATQKPAGALSDHLFEEALRNPTPENARLVVFTAGGTGAGKTTALRYAELRDIQFVYDSNLGSKRSGVQKIEAAKAAGNRVRVLFVNRDPVEALTGGVLPRAMEEGRVVDLEAHARMYRDAAENFGYLMRRYAGDPEITFVAIDNSQGPTGMRFMPLEKAGAIRYSTSKLRPLLGAALEREYACGNISESVYRATLSPSSTEEAGGVPRDPGPGGAQAGGQEPHPGDVRGDSGRIDAGEPEKDSSAKDRSAETQPGSIIKSLWVPLTCGLLDIPYIWFKTHGANALTSIADYQPEYTLTRFAHTWALYLNYLVLGTDRIKPGMAIAILAGLLVVAALARSKKLLFAWALLFVPVLPVAFFAFRGGYVLYTSYPGWCLYAAILLAAAENLFRKYQLAVAAGVFLIVAWRFGKLNLHDQRADARTWLYASPAQVRQMAQEVKALEPTLPPGARCLFLNDPFSTDEWTPYFIMKLLYRDDTLTPDRIKMMDRKPADWSNYQYVFTYERGKYRLLKP